MHIAFLNPHGNFDPHDSHWTAHPDFGGQLVYVKQVALAMAEAGHTSRHSHPTDHRRRLAGVLLTGGGL